MKQATQLARAALVGALVISTSSFALAHQAQPPVAARAAVPAILVVKRQLGAPSAGVADLKFRDLFKLPVGPRGLEPTERLRQLDGKRVRIVGYMVRQETPSAGGFLLSPLPVEAGDEDESLADDIPASAIFIRLPRGNAAIVPPLPGLLKISGTLRVGAYGIAGTARMAAARIELDAEPERALLGLVKRMPSKAKGKR